MLLIYDDFQTIWAVNSNRFCLKTNEFVKSLGFHEWNIIKIVLAQTYIDSDFDTVLASYTQVLIFVIYFKNYSKASAKHIPLSIVNATNTSDRGEKPPSLVYTPMQHAFRRTRVEQISSGYCRVVAK